MPTSLTTTKQPVTLTFCVLKMVSVGNVVEVGLQETTAGSHVSRIGTGAGANIK